MKSALRHGAWGIVAIIVGIGLSIWGSIVLMKATASSSWPNVQGEVIDSKVDVRYELSDTQKRKPTQTAVVTYRYTIEGTTYTNDTISYGQFSSGRGNVQQEIVNRYPKGKAVDVYYDPKNPNEAVLEPGVTWSSYLLLGFGIVIIMAGLGSVATKIMKRDHAQEDSAEIVSLDE